MEGEEEGLAHSGLKHSEPLLGREDGGAVTETRVRWGELAPREPDPLRMEVRKEWVPRGRDSLTLEPHNSWDPGIPSAQGAASCRVLESRNDEWGTRSHHPAAVSILGGQRCRGGCGASVLLVGGISAMNAAR